MASKSYYVLSPDPELPFTYGDISFSPINQGIYSNLWGDRILPEGLTATARLSKPKRILRRDFICLNAGFIGTENFYDLLKEGTLKTAIKLHPCNVYHHDGEHVSKDFSFLEFRCFMDAFDYENSEYPTSDGLKILSESGVIESCTKLVIDGSKTNQFDIFLLKRVNFFDPIISDRFLNALLKNKIKGVKVTPTESYTWDK